MKIPETQHWFASALQGWTALSSFRQSSGFGISPLSLETMVAYCDLNGIPFHQRWWLIRQMNVIDVTFVSYHSKKLSTDK